MKKPLKWFFPRLFSVNQHSFYGAAADLCKELSKDSEVARKPAANEDLESMENPVELPFADPHTNSELQGNLLQDHERKFKRIPEHQKLSPNCAATLIEHLMKKNSMKWRTYVESTRHLEVEKHPEREGGFSETRRSARSWMWRSVFMKPFLLKVLSTELQWNLLQKQSHD